MQKMRLKRMDLIYLFAIFAIKAIAVYLNLVGVRKNFKMQVVASEMEKCRSNSIRSCMVHFSISLRKSGWKDKIKRQL